MQKVIKAMLLSALLYPGLGHYQFNRKFSALVIAVIFSIPFIILIINLFNKAQVIALKIRHGEVAYDISAITHAVRESLYRADPNELTLYINIMLVIWCFAILDTYRVGKSDTKE